METESETTTETAGLEWLEAPNHPLVGELPEWQRLAGVDSRGEVFLPAGVFAPEALLADKARAQGATVEVRHGHAYLPVRWLAAHLTPNQRATVQFWSSLVWREYLRRHARVLPEGTLRWFQVPAEHFAPDEVPGWLCIVGLRADGEIYVPIAWAFARTQEAARCHGQERVRAVLRDGHLYVPLPWLSPFCEPAIQEGLRALEPHIRMAAAATVPTHPVAQ